MTNSILKQHFSLMQVLCVSVLHPLLSLQKCLIVLNTKSNSSNQLRSRAETHKESIIQCDLLFMHRELLKTARGSSFLRLAARKSMLKLVFCVLKCGICINYQAVLVVWLEELLLSVRSPVLASYGCFLFTVKALARVPFMLILIQKNNTSATVLVSS